MKTLVTVLALIAVSSISLGADPVVFINEDGTARYWDGESSNHVPIKVVYPTSGPPVPPTPPNPNPPSPNDLSSKVRSWAEEIDDPVTALLLSKVYAQVGSKIADGTIPLDTDIIDGALNILVEEAIDRTPSGEGKEDEWNSFHDDKVAVELFQLLVSNDRTLTKAQWQGFCNSVSEGLEDASKGHAVNDIIQDLINALIQFLLDFLLNWLNNITVVPNTVSVWGPVYV